MFAAVIVCCQFLLGASFPSAANSDETASYLSTADQLTEVVSLRTETVKNFQTADGGYIAAVYDEPVHFLTEEGNWEEIDNSLSAVGISYAQLQRSGTLTASDNTESVSAVSYLQNKANSFQVSLPNELNNSNPVMITYRDFTLSFQLRSDTSAMTAQAVVQEAQRAESEASVNASAGKTVSQKSAVELPNQAASVSYKNILSSYEKTSVLISVPSSGDRSSFCLLRIADDQKRLFRKLLVPGERRTYRNTNVGVRWRNPSGGRNHGRDMPLRHRQDSGRYGRKHGHGNNMAENRSDDQNGANSRPAEHRKRGLLD